MNRERHRKIARLFLEVCDLPEQEAERVLDEACRGDPDLRAEVESLLAHDRHASQRPRRDLNDRANPRGRSP